MIFLPSLLREITSLIRLKAVLAAASESRLGRIVFLRKVLRRGTRMKSADSLDVVAGVT